MIKFNSKLYHCPLEMTIDLIGGKWKVLLLWHLSKETLRFNELQKLFPQATQKMLTQQLRNLEENGLVSRQIYPQVPPKVEYSITDFGKSLMPVLYTMNQWGTDYVNSSEASFDTVQPD